MRDREDVDHFVDSGECELFTEKLKPSDYARFYVQEKKRGAMKKAYKVTTTGDGKRRKEVTNEWKQGFLVVPAVDIFKPDTIRQTLEWFNGQTGRN